MTAQIRRGLRSLLLVLAAACGSVESEGEPDGGIDVAPDGGADAAVPDADSSSDQDGSTSACEPETSTCTGGELTVCGSDGTVESTETCALGCADTADRCTQVDPSNGLASQLDEASSAPEISFSATSGKTTINTDTGDVTHGTAPITVPSAVESQGSGLPSIRVFRVGSLDIANDVEIIGNNAIAIVSHGDVQIGAGVQLAARWTEPGPGAVTGDDPCQGKDATVLDDPEPRVPGAGGGGNGTNGGGGGNASKDNLTTAFGADSGVAGGSVTIEPLRGGCGGGDVLSPNDAYYATDGGAGGGALQIASRTRIVVTSDGIVDAGGGGANFGNSGAGGGSGGSILLEAPEVTVEGTLAANGGGGGCSNFEGENGRVAYEGGTLEASGGACDGGSSGRGGDGGSKDRLADGGDNADTSTAVPIAGGGGGATGRIRINTASGSFAKGSSSLVSPTASEATISTR